MADKTVAFALPNYPQQSHVTTAGSIAADSIIVVFDDASTPSKILEALEVAKIEIQDYYNKR